MIVVSDTSPLNYLIFDETVERLDKDTTFYVTADVIGLFRRRVRDRRHPQAQDLKTAEQQAEDQGNEQG